MWTTIKTFWYGIPWGGRLFIGLCVFIAVPGGVFSWFSASPWASGIGAVLGLIAYVVLAVRAKHVL